MSMFASKRRALVGALALFATTAACHQDASDPAEVEQSIVEKAGMGLYADNLPEEYRAELVAADKHRLHLDATGKRKFFPMPRGVREFESREALAKFAKAELNAEVELGKQGWILRGHTTSHGESVWLEVDTQMLYGVTDPVMALLGGTTGKVIVGKESYCLDGRKSCDEGLAEYLVPIADPTALSHIDRCSDNRAVCAKYHSFYNKVDLCFFKYARHGGKTERTRNDPDGYTFTLREVRVCGPDDPGAFDIGKLASGGEWSAWICIDLQISPNQEAEPRTISVDGPVIGTPGHFTHPVDGPGPTEASSTESAVWSATGGGPFECAPESLEIAATFVCNTHRAVTVDTGFTGNGPNHSVCFE